MNLRNSILTVTLMLSGSFQTMAHDKGGAFEACFAETGVTRPERGQRPSDEDRAKMDACLESKGLSREHRRERRQAFKSAMEACATETGVTRPEKGTKPSEDDRAKMKACLEGKEIGRAHV